MRALRWELLQITWRQACHHGALQSTLRFFLIWALVFSCPEYPIKPRQTRTMGNPSDPAIQMRVEKTSKPCIYMGPLLPRKQKGHVLTVVGRGQGLDPVQFLLLELFPWKKLPILRSSVSFYVNQRHRTLVQDEMTLSASWSSSIQHHSVCICGTSPTHPVLELHSAGSSKATSPFL